MSERVIIKSGNGYLIDPSGPLMTSDRKRATRYTVRDARKILKSNDMSYFAGEIINDKSKP
jgi:hypothetical protein